VAEFDKYLHDELDLMREAANASQLRRNFAESDLLCVPEMFWDWCTSVLVMERMHGIPISSTESLKAAGVDMHKLAATASRSSSPRCSATASSTPTCTPATSWSVGPRRSGATSRWTSASSAR
jgi:hypothetical protein